MKKYLNLKKKKKKIDTKPTVTIKGIKSAYFCFMDVMRNKLKEEENLTGKEAVKRMGELWKNIDAYEKLKYQRNYLN